MKTKSSGEEKVSEYKDKVVIHKPLEEEELLALLKEDRIPEKGVIEMEGRGVDEEKKKHHKHKGCCC
jgi:hypothetical protein